MEIILKTDVENLGYKDQIVNVKAGYANNFLIPQGYAINATKSAKKAHEETLKQRSHKEAKMISDAEAIAAKVSAMTIAVTVKANENGKIFGTVTTAEVAAAISAKGVEVDKRNVKIATIKEVGSHIATVRIFKEVVAEVSIEVVSDTPVVAPKAEAKPAAKKEAAPAPEVETVAEQTEVAEPVTEE